MHKIDVLYKMGCSKCVSTIDFIRTLQHCNPDVKVNAKLVNTPAKAHRLGFNPNLSPMVFIDGKYAGSGHSSPCRPCSQMSGKPEVCSSGLTPVLETKLKSVFCGDAACCA
jgi:hypothetical protein